MFLIPNLVAILQGIANIKIQKTGAKDSFFAGRLPTSDLGVRQT